MILRLGRKMKVALVTSACSLPIENMSVDEVIHPILQTMTDILRNQDLNDYPTATRIHQELQAGGFIISAEEFCRALDELLREGRISIEGRTPEGNDAIISPNFMPMSSFGTR